MKGGKQLLSGHWKSLYPYERSYIVSTIVEICFEIQKWNDVYSINLLEANLLAKWIDDIQNWEKLETSNEIELMKILDKCQELRLCSNKAKEIQYESMQSLLRVIEEIRKEIKTNWLDINEDFDLDQFNLLIDTHLNTPDLITISHREKLLFYTKEVRYFFEQFQNKLEESTKKIFLNHYIIVNKYHMLICWQT